MDQVTLPRATVQQVLEALQIGYDSAKAEADQYHAAMAGYRPHLHAQMDADVQKIAQAITALRAALEQQEHSPDCALLKIPSRDCDCQTEQEPSDGAIRAAWLAGYTEGEKAALEQPEQEPDCWAILTPNGSRLVSPDEAKGRKNAYPLYTHPPRRDAGQKPVAWMYVAAHEPRNRHLEWTEDRKGYRGDWIKTPLYEAKLQPEQEPVVWECKAGGLKPLSQRLYDVQPDSIKRHYSRIPHRDFLPIEPTTAMIEAGAQRLVSWEDDSTWPDSWSAMQVAAARNDAERVWRSMWLAAQPTAPTTILQPEPK